MIHTYREPDALESGGARSVRSAFFPLLVIVALLYAAGSTFESFTWNDAEGLGLFVVFVGVVGVLGLRHDRHSSCSEVRLGDDGACELERKARVIRLHVNQIRSVEYLRRDDGELYTIRYEGGKLHVSEQMAGFADFLARLKTLNPGVELSGFPADAWPGLDLAATSVTRRIRDALFPVGVIVLLVWLALETIRPF